MRHLKAVIIPLLLVIMCGWLLRSAYFEVRDRAIDQLNNQQTIMAETAARGIESFFDHISELLTGLSIMKEIASMDDRGRWLVRSFYQTHSSEIRGITRVDPSGKILYTYPEIQGGIGTDLSFQEHIQTVMQTRRPVVSDVFPSVQGFMTAAMHVPVFEDGTFVGSIAVLIPFDHLSRKFLEPIRVGNSGYAWTISQKGTEFYCPVAGHTGKSVFENCRNYPELLSLAREMVKGNRGTTSYHFDHIRNKTVESVKKQAAYVPVRLPGTFWSIAVATPEDELLEILHGFKNRWLLLIGLLMLVTIVCTSYALRVFKILKEEERRCRAETALKASEEQYRELVENANSIILRMNVSGNITFFNKFAESFFGYKEEEILGSNVVGTIVPEVESTGRPLRTMVGDFAINPERYVNNINENMRRNGERVWIAWTNRPIRNADGRITGILCIGNDITERRRAEARLRESEERYRAIFENTGTATVILDEDTTILLANTEFLHLTGCTREEIEGRKSWREFVVEEDLECMVKQHRLRRKDPEKGSKRYNFRLVDKNGRIKDILLTIDMIPATGNSVASLLDITELNRQEAERRILEERLHRAEKMEVLGTMAGGVAHDLNNVLGIVVGYSELAIAELGGESSPVRSHIGEIMKGGERAAAIAQDLLTLTRRGVTNRQVVNLNSIIMECRELPEFAKILSYCPNIRTEWDLEPDLLNMSGSPVHLGKTLLNLVSNAVEAMPHGGTITVRTRNEYLDRPISGYDEVNEGDYVVLTVSDTGEGMAEADLNRIFEPFYTKKVMGRSGTGLGLAVVWGTVKDHLGYIDVESEKDKGTVFSLFFPITREEITREKVPLCASEYTGNGESILIVDDVREQRELATMMLNKLNYRVVSASSGEEAVRYLGGQSFDIVVLDMIMDPGMDGLETYRKMLEIHPGQKAIIVSGFAENERVSRALALGAATYVKKPYVLEKLGMAVRKGLDRPA
ncbi:MAG: PAS domain S-box protein [Syntrophobacteraceae bacterium]